jgi:hypothetical protein
VIWKNSSQQQNWSKKTKYGLFFMVSLNANAPKVKIPAASVNLGKAHRA